MVEVGVPITGRLGFRDGSVRLVSATALVAKPHLADGGIGESLPLVDHGPWVPGKTPLSASEPRTPYDSAHWRAADRAGAVKLVQADTSASGAVASRISNGGLSMTYCCAGPRTFAYSDRERSKGKWYVEFLLEVPRGARLATSWTDFGIIAPGGERSVESAGSSPLQIFALKSGPSRRVKAIDKDVFGMAIDFDAQRLYFHQNGVWLRGAPGEASPAAGDSLVAGRPYRVFVASGSGSETAGMSDAWTVNFGAKRFLYPIPTGYRPFDDS
jgi:hypothetical protein